jgi:hypothetical protein
MAGTANKTTLQVVEDNDQQHQHCQDLYGLKGENVVHY